VYEDSDGSTISSSTALPYFDGNFWNIMISSGSEFKIYSNQTNGDTINYSEYFSGSLNSRSWNDNLYTYVCSGSFNGAIQEYRLWNTTPTVYEFNNHSKYIRSINIGNSISSSYDNLLLHYSFDYPKNHGPSGDSDILDIKPNQTWTNTGTTSGYGIDSSSYPYSYEYFTQDMSAATPLIGIANNNNKIRIESSSMLRGLDPNISVESGEFKDSTPDSNKIGVQYSPVDTINLDIIAQYADYNFDNFIGDPSDM